MLSPIPVLVYHRVDRSGRPFATAPELFERHLAWLGHHGYHSLTASQLTAVVAGHAERPVGRVVALTFDDGYADLATEVAPALRRHAMCATAFLITDRCPQETRAGDEHLSWSAARALAADGVLEFHTHTHSHGRWSLGSDQAAAVSDDIATSIATLSTELGRPATCFDQVAWPWGRTCEAWEEAVAGLGVRSQYVVQRGAVTRPGERRRLPRLLVDGASTATLAGWMRVLSSRGGARATNAVFGAVRQRRQGGGYR